MVSQENASHSTPQTSKRLSGGTHTDSDTTDRHAGPEQCLICTGVQWLKSAKPLGGRKDGSWGSRTQISDSLL